MEFINCSAGESSQRLYRHNLKKLNKGVEPTNFMFLKKTEEVMKLMPTNKNTQRTAIISAVNACKGRKGFGKALKFYTDKMDELNNFLRDATTKTDRYKENELSWDEIIKARDELPKDSIEYVLLCLYTMTPPRRTLDYIMTTKPTENGNFYNGKEFIFQNFKTKKTYNSQVIPVPTELKNVIDAYLDSRPFKSDHLLIKKSGIPFKTRDIQLTLNKILQKKVSCTMLRSIYLSSRYKDVLEDMKEDAAAMGTSSAVIQSNYVKH